MKKNLLLFCLFVVTSLFVVSSCKQDYSCDDGKQNQGETGIDCGGPCDACANAVSCTNGVQDGGELGVDCGGPCPNQCSSTPTCTDGIQNGTETGVDCGGSCPACNTSSTNSLSCKINGTTFTATTATATAVQTSLAIIGMGATTTITINHIGAFATGTYPASATESMLYANTNGNVQCVATSNGSVTFTTFNTTTKKIVGTFLFDCTSVTGGSGNSITEGAFDITYN